MAAGVGRLTQCSRPRRHSGARVTVAIDMSKRMADSKPKPYFPTSNRSSRSIEYKGRQLEDMDLDAILRQKPEYVLVDELAHTNSEGMRHAKRYQDVLE